MYDIWRRSYSHIYYCLWPLQQVFLQFLSIHAFCPKKLLLKQLKPEYRIAPECCAHGQHLQLHLNQCKIPPHCLAIYQLTHKSLLLSYPHSIPHLDMDMGMRLRYATLSYLYSCCHSDPIERVYVSLHTSSTHKQLSD